MDARGIVILLAVLTPITARSAEKDDSFAKAASHKKEVEWDLRLSQLPNYQRNPKFPEVAKAISKIKSNYRLRDDLIQWGIWATKGNWRRFRMLGAFRPIAGDWRLTLLRLEFGPLGGERKILLVEGTHVVLDWFELVLRQQRQLTEPIEPKEPKNQRRFRSRLHSQEISPPAGQVAFFDALATIGNSKAVPELRRDPAKKKGQILPSHHFMIFAGDEPHLQVAFPGQKRSHVAKRVCRIPEPGFYEVLNKAQPSRSLLTIGEEGIAFSIVNDKGKEPQFLVHHYKQGAYDPIGVQTTGLAPKRWARIAGANPKESPEAAVIAAVASEAYWREHGHLVDPELWAIPNDQ